MRSSKGTLHRYDGRKERESKRRRGRECPLTRTTPRSPGINDVGHPRARDRSTGKRKQTTERKPSRGVGVQRYGCIRCPRKRYRETEEKVETPEGRETGGEFTPVPRKNKDLGRKESTVQDDLGRVVSGTDVTGIRVWFREQI